MAEEKKTMQTEKIEPEKVRTYVNGDTVFKVGCYFSQNGTVPFGIFWSAPSAVKQKHG